MRSPTSRVSGVMARNDGKTSVVWLQAIILNQIGCHFAGRVYLLEKFIDMHNSDDTSA
ncbi:MAG: hypothetical protein QXN15_09955 [Candidatus Jordarchaeales archaeon]